MLIQAVFCIVKERFLLILINKTLKNVHDDVVNRIMCAPVNLFFDVTPNGSIMKRFTDDMNVIEHIVRSIDHCCEISMGIASTFFMLG